MALVNVQHKPTTGTARQFDGSFAALTDVLSARSLARATLTITYDNAGNMASFTISGGGFSGTVTVSLNDWIFFPSDGSPAFSIASAEASSKWAIV
jgi:hypothetical protein